MAEPISIQQLKDASEDAISLAEFIYKPANVMIPRRLASDINSLQYYLDYMSSYAQHSYETYDEMVANAPNLPNGVSAFVTNDLDTEKNGIYTYNGDSFVKGDYQPENAAKEFVEAKLGGLEVFDGKVRAQDVSTADGSTQNLKNTMFSLELSKQKLDTGITATAKFDGVARTQAAKNLDIVSVKDFGAKGDGVTDDTAAIRLACQSIQSSGGGVLFFPKSVGDYLFELELDSTLFEFENLTHFSIKGGGVVVRDTTQYSRTIRQEAKFLTFSNCTRVSSSKGVYLKSQTYDIALQSAYSGISWFTFLRGCKGVRIYSDMYGGNSAVRSRRELDDPTDLKTSDIVVDSTIQYIRYGYFSRWSGDNAKVSLRANNCGRVFFIYGVSDVSLHVISKDVGTSLIKGYSGLGCSNIDVYYEDTESSTLLPTTINAGDLVSMHIDGVTPTTMSNINIQFNVYNYSGGWGHTLTINKYFHDTTIDTVGRGHIIDGLSVSGFIKGATGVNAIRFNEGTFTSPDKISRMTIDDLEVDGGSFNLILGDALQDVLKARNIIAPRNTLNFKNSTGLVEFTNCHTTSFSSTDTDVSKHRYIDCSMSYPASQSNINKEFINTVVGDNVVNALYSTGLSGSTKSAKIVEGDLSTPTNIFKISNLSSGLFRLTYFLIKERSDTSPTTRAEKFGTKRWTGSADSSGVAVLQTAVVDDTVEGVLNDFVEPLDVTLIDGDSTGYYIAVSCAGLTFALSKAVFSLEAITVNPLASIEPIN